jgi:branched-subunit amino acid ABC-type transport system permease component
MRTRAKQELFVGLQYLLIGIVAEIAVLRYFRRDEIATQVATWCLIVIALGLVRLIIIVLASQLRRDHWQSISRRNWI